MSPPGSCSVATTASSTRVPPPHRTGPLGITPDEIDGGHCVALSRPSELADRLEAYLDPRAPG